MRVEYSTHFAWTCIANVNLKTTAPIKPFINTHSYIYALPPPLKSIIYLRPTQNVKGKIPNPIGMRNALTIKERFRAPIILGLEFTKSSQLGSSTFYRAPLKRAIWPSSRENECVCVYLCAALNCLNVFQIPIENHPPYAHPQLLTGKAPTLHSVPEHPLGLMLNCFPHFCTLRCQCHYYHPPTHG